MRKDFFEEAFEGYNVPKNIKRISKEICKRFAIFGICDPMYISNVIAAGSNIGNGQGDFTGDKVINSKEIAERIQSCYGCNILQDETKEIEFCLTNGFMDHEKAVIGLKSFIKRINTELRSCEDWRKEYLGKVLMNINESIEFFQKK